MVETDGSARSADPAPTPLMNSRREYFMLVEKRKVEWE
jgi:hypothetical protein